jgi:hypothetical protein
LQWPHSWVASLLSRQPPHLPSSFPAHAHAINYAAMCTHSYNPSCTHRETYACTERERDIIVHACMHKRSCARKLPLLAPSSLSPACPPATPPSPHPHQNNPSPFYTSPASPLATPPTPLSPPTHTHPTPPSPASLAERSVRPGQHKASTLSDGLLCASCGRGHALVLFPPLFLTFPPSFSYFSPLFFFSTRHPVEGGMH